jgi:6-phosphogluconolactonase/glucosamine-6-phosphate isomerase/deaminase
VVARGAKKAAAIRAMLAEPSRESPASVVPRTRALDVLLDRDSLSGLLDEERAT